MYTGKKTSGTAPKGKESKVKLEEKKWTPKDDAARKIQSNYRGFMARKLLKKKQQEKIEYQNLMDKLEKEVGSSYEY